MKIRISLSQKTKIGIILDKDKQEGGFVVENSVRDGFSFVAIGKK